VWSGWRCPESKLARITARRSKKFSVHIFHARTLLLIRDKIPRYSPFLLVGKAFSRQGLAQACCGAGARFAAVCCSDLLSSLTRSSVVRAQLLADSIRILVLYHVLRRCMFPFVEWRLIFFVGGLVLCPARARMLVLFEISRWGGW